MFFVSVSLMNFGMYEILKKIIKNISRIFHTENCGIRVKIIIMALAKYSTEVLFGCL